MGAGVGVLTGVGVGTGAGGVGLVSGVAGVGLVSGAVGVVGIVSGTVVGVGILLELGLAWSRALLELLAVVYVYGGSSLKGFGAVRIVLVECCISIIMSFPCFFQYSRSSS